MDDQAGGGVQKEAPGSELLRQAAEHSDQNEV